MLRHSATRSLFERRDLIVVASISCIYGLGIPSEYPKAAVKFEAIRFVDPTTDESTLKRPRAAGR